VLASGAVACWGYNDVGELGNGSVYGPDGNNGYDTPQYVTGLSGASAVTSGGPSDGLTDGGVTARCSRPVRSTAGVTTHSATWATG